MEAACPLFAMNLSPGRRDQSLSEAEIQPLEIAMSRLVNLATDLQVTGLFSMLGMIASAALVQNATFAATALLMGA